jgi:hypothetical protein
VYASVLSGAAPTPLQDSPYHGDYPMCGGVWSSVDGKRLYTACGNTFTSSADASLDLRYAGALALTPAAGVSGSHRALALSENPTGSRLVLLEQPFDACNPARDGLIACFTTVSTYDTANLALTDRRALAPITVGGDRFAQMGRYLFHRNNGSAVLLSELRSAPDPAASIRVSAWP